MNIVGQGHKSIVILDEANSSHVKKFYLTKEEWNREKANIRFLVNIQKQGFNLGYKFPNVLGSVQGKWKIKGKEYCSCNRMNLITGMVSSQYKGDARLFGKNLGKLLFKMHTRFKPYKKQWITGFGEKDTLFFHILHDKADKVIAEEKDIEIKTWVKQAKDYLKDKEYAISLRRTLSHTDINLPNIILGSKGHIEGMVDWGSFGLTNPTLSMYQLVPKSDIWIHARKEYENLGGIIEDDILYAAATIHLAWVPIICKQLGFALPEDETRNKLELTYKSFRMTS